MKRKPSRVQRLFLEDLARGGNGYRDMPGGRSHSGGWSATPIACYQHGWIEYPKGSNSGSRWPILTDAGRAVIS